MKASELRQQDRTTLQTALRDLVKKQFQLKMQHGSGQLPGNHQLRQVRRDIARIKMVIAETDKKGE